MMNDNTRRIFHQNVNNKNKNRFANTSQMTKP